MVDQKIWPQARPTHKLFEAFFPSPTSPEFLLKWIDSLKCICIYNIIKKENFLLVFVHFPSYNVTFSNSDTALPQFTQENLSSSVLKMFKALTLAKKSLLGIRSTSPTTYWTSNLGSLSHLKLNISKIQLIISSHLLIPKWLL